MVNSQRLLTVLVGFILIFSILVLAPIELFVAAICLLSLLGFIEFLRMFKIGEDRGLYRGSLIIFTLIDLTYIIPPFRNLSIGLTAPPLFIFILALIVRKPNQNGIEKTAIVIMGAVYTTLLLHYLIAMRSLANGRELVFILSLGTWTRDVIAYLFGRLIKAGHTILPAISPRKTYEGAVCGLVFTTIAVGVSGRLLVPTWSVTTIITIGSLIGILGQIGDLFESWLKRNANVVDSSKIFLAQGGILDSFDSFVFTAPAIYFFLILLKS